MHIDELRPALERFVASTWGEAARLGRLSESDGHAGLTFLFEVDAPGAAAAGYVIKLAPRGVRLRGNTDVYRQAPLQRALREAGVPVPAVPWAAQDNPWFDTPFIVMERLPGNVFFVWDPPAEFERSQAAADPLWRLCAAALPAVHRFDWAAQLADWEQPEPLVEQITRWERIYAQAPEPAWTAAAEATARALRDSLPSGAPVGLFHGDYQPGNVLFHQGRLSGIIDWEISGIGAQLLDIGWLMMAADPANWHADWNPVFPPSPATLRGIYEDGMGQRFDDIPWYQALAGYRLASIACLNVKLHRKGQRHDPIWEKMGLCVLPMYHRAQAILASL